MTLDKWDKEKVIRFVIDNIGMTENLYNFPVLINLAEQSGINNYNNSSIFTTLSGVSNKKISLIYPDTQVHIVNGELKTYVHSDIEECYCEVVFWDTDNKHANLWVNIPVILHDQPTDFYLFYSDNVDDNIRFVGDTGSSTAMKVWDEHFKLVYHLSQDPSGTPPQIIDSTNNLQHGTAYGNMTSNDLVNGLNGKSIEFDGVDDYIHISSMSSDNQTLEHFLKTPSSIPTNSKGLLYKAPDTDYEREFGFDIEENTGKFKFSVYDGSSDASGIITTANNICNGDYKHLVGIKKYDANGDTYSIYNNGTLDGEITVTYNGFQGSNEIVLGKVSSNSNSDRYFTGKLSEVRISNITRSNTWVYLTSKTLHDELLTIYTGKKYQVSGYIKELDSLVNRQVFMYHRSSGYLVDKTISMNGYYTLFTSFSGIHNVVCLDADADPDFDDTLLSKITPTEVL